MNVESPTPQRDQSQKSTRPISVEPLPPISVPPEHQWRHFRVHVLPFVAFGVVGMLTVLLWGRNLANPLVPGEAEGLEADLVSPVAGRVVQLNAMLHQEVKAGDILALIDFTEPSVRSNRLASIRAEMDAIRAEAGFNAGDRVRYSQLKLDWLTRRMELAQDKISLPIREAEFERDTKLFHDSYFSDSLYYSNKLNLDLLKLRIDESPSILATTEQDLKDLDPITVGQQSHWVMAQIKSAEERMHLAEAEMQPIPLRAPISGRVTRLDILTGGAVAPGGVVLNIASPKVERIVGFITQPLRISPQIGMKVVVRSRNLRRVAGQAIITSIGPRIEPFATPLRIQGLAPAQERGLPVILSVPQQMVLQPGELVDLTFVKN